MSWRDGQLRLQHLQFNVPGAPILREIGFPVVFDTTGIQQPGGRGVLRRRRKFVPVLRRAAVSVGNDAVFAEYLDRTCALGRAGCRPAGNQVPGLGATLIARRRHRDRGQGANSAGRVNPVVRRRRLVRINRRNCCWACPRPDGSLRRRPDTGPLCLWRVQPHFARGADPNYEDQRRTVAAQAASCILLHNVAALGARSNT